MGDTTAQTSAQHSMENSSQQDHQVRVDNYDNFVVERDQTPFLDQDQDDIRTGGEGGTFRGYPLNPLLNRVACGGATNQHMLTGYDGLDYDGQDEPARNRRQEFDGYNIGCNSYSPPGAEMGYRASTVVTYHTEIQTGHVPGMRGHLPWGAGVPSHCKWSPEDRDTADIEPRKGAKMAGNDGNFHIPDTTLAQLSVKELNKRVQNLGREDVIALKQRRRTLKNRGYAVQCRLRRQQYKESLEMEIQGMRDQVKKAEEELKHCMHDRDYYKVYYQKCCGLRHGSNLPLNLEMINNNHDQDFKRSDHDIKLHHPLSDDQFRREFELTGGYGGREGGGGLKMGGGGELFKYEPREEKMMSDNRM